MKKYHLSACGGTFDLFHKGHEDFLNSIYRDSEKIIIGITSDKFAESKSLYESFKKREDSLRRFISDNKINAQILKIDDIYGPTLSDKYKFDALFVTEDSVKGAEKINQKRKTSGLSPLKIVKIALLRSLDGKVLSSTRIKNGEVDRNGESYTDENLNCDYLLPDNLREKLSKPFGEVIPKIKKSGKIIAIGDETVKTFTSKKLYPSLSIVDLKNNREKKYGSVTELGLSSEKIIKAHNPSGCITKELFKAVKNGLTINNSTIMVEGEEDLAVIPAVLFAPLGCAVYYGQPGQGIVEIIVTEQKKVEIKLLLSQFTRKVI